MGFCVDNPAPISAPPTGGYVNIVVNFPDFPQYPSHGPKYTITTNITNDFNSDGCINLEEYGDKSIAWKMDIEPRVLGSVRFYQANPGVTPTFKATYSLPLEYCPTSAHPIPSTAVKINGPHHFWHFDCSENSCSSNKGSNELIFSYLNNITYGECTQYAFKYQTKDLNGDWHTWITPDPGIKNGGQAYMRMLRYGGFITAILAVAAGLGLALLGLFLRPRQS